MVGASLALLLNNYSDDRLKILVIESFSANETDNSMARPSFDARSTALSYSSRLVLESLGLFSPLSEYCAPINSIHVGERGRLGSAVMSRDEVDWPSLGYVVENAYLGKVLLEAVDKNSNIEFYCPACAISINTQSQGVLVEVEHKEQGKNKIRAQLAIVADGAQSELRRQLGIVAKIHNYQQTALIANVSFTKPHNGRAYERFTDQGPMALLPLTDSERGEPRSALVWTMAEAQADTLRQSEDKAFLRALQQRFGQRQGEFIRVGARASYPLMMIQAQEQVRSSIVVMGNAAHSLHPVAGQGFNLALRDCARLAVVTASALNEGVPLGNLSSLTRYLSQQQFDQQKTLAFSDYLPAIFSNRLWGLSSLRRLGLSALDVVPAAKKYFIRHAAGLHDGAAALPRGQTQQATHEY